MKTSTTRLATLATCLLLASCAVQPSPPEAASAPQIVAAPGADASDQAAADFLLTCASSQTDNLLVLKASGQNVEPLYRDIGYSLGAAQAYSSKAYAEPRFQELRQAGKARASQALAVSDSARASSVAAYLNTVQAQMAECASYQRANREQINARMRQAGVVK